MSLTSGINKFKRRMGLRAEELGRNAEKAVRKAAITADTHLVMATPVDTGRARGNWLTSVGNPLEEYDEDRMDQAGGPTLAQGRSVINSWKLGMGSIFICNSVPYIVLLDSGKHSLQAPHGMTRGAIQAARSSLVNVKLLR